MADNEQTNQQSYDYENVPLVARLTPDGSQMRFYGLLNGVELPLVYLNVHDYREKFDEAKQAKQDGDQKQKPSR